MNRRWLTLAALLLSLPALAEEPVPTERAKRAVRFALSQTAGPLTNGASIRVRTDENGYLLVRDPGSGGGQTPGPLTTFANLRVRTDENGYLLVRDLLGGGGGSGTVTSVGLSLPSIFTVSGSPVTTSGTLTGSLASQTAATFFAGPAIGSAAAPTFRSIATTDVPTLNQNTTGSAASFTGSLAGDVTGTQSATTIAADSVALTTDTTGNYVASVATSALTGLTGGSAGSEAAALTLGLDYSQALFGDPALASNACVFGQNGIVCEGLTANDLETWIIMPNPTGASDFTITLPSASTTLVGRDTTDTLLGKTLAAAGNVIDADTAIALASVPAQCPVVGGQMTVLRGIDTDGSPVACLDPIVSADMNTSAEIAAIVTDETGTDKIVFSDSPVLVTPNIGSATGSISGNAGTATALAANGANCAAGNYPLGVDASGAVEDCTAVSTGSETQATVLTKVSLRF